MSTKEKTIKKTTGSKTAIKKEVGKRGRPKGTKSKNPRYMDLEAINKNKALVKAKIKKLLENGRVEIETKKQLENFPLGSLVSYMTIDDLYRSGGFLKTIKDDYFVLVGGTSGNPISFSVQFDNIKSMYVGNPFETKKDEVSIVPTKKAKTRYPVKIGDTVVYYANDVYDYKRFLETEKYKRYIKWYESFGKKKIEVNDEDKPKKKMIKKKNTD